MIQRVAGLLEPALEAFDLLQHGLARRAAKDPLVDQDACNRTGARDRQAHGEVMLVVELREGKTRLILDVADSLTKRQTTKRCAKPFIAGLLGADAVVALAGLQHSRHGLAFCFALHALAACVTFAGFAFAPTDHRTPPSVALAQSRMAMASASLSSVGKNPRSRRAAITAALSALPLPVAKRLMVPTGTPW